MGSVFVEILRFSKVTTLLGEGGLRVPPPPPPPRPSSTWSLHSLSQLVPGGPNCNFLVNALEVGGEKMVSFVFVSRWPCMEYCCFVWAGAPNYYLESLDKLQNWIFLDCFSFISCLLNIGSSLKCSQHKSFLYIFLW